MPRQFTDVIFLHTWHNFLKTAPHLCLQFTYGIHGLHEGLLVSEGLGRMRQGFPAIISSGDVGTVLLVCVRLGCEFACGTIAHELFSERIPAIKQHMTLFFPDNNKHTLGRYIWVLAPLEQSSLEP